MTDKQIIVDNVDVSKCDHVYARTSLFKEKTLVQCSAFFLENEDSCCDCSDNPNCYYKQLKRKEQECEELKKTLIKIKEISKEEIKNVSEEFIRRTPMFGVHKQILQKISEVISE